MDSESDPARGHRGIHHDGKTYVAMNGPNMILCAATAIDEPNAGGHRRTLSGLSLIAKIAGKILLRWSR